MSEKRGLELDSIRNLPGPYIVQIQCAGTANDGRYGKFCGEVLQESKPMSGPELAKHWTFLAISSPLMTDKCPKGCRASYSDCNANTELVIVKAGESKP